LLTGPATKLLYSVAGRVVLINAYDAWSLSAVTQVFSGWFLQPLSNQATNEIDITLSVRCGVTPPPIPVDLTTFEITHGGICFTDNDTYYITFGRSLIMFGPGRSPTVNLWVDQPYEVPSEIGTQLISHALSPALRRANVFEIHSAGVIAPNRSDAVMLAGPSGSGKSTLTSQLARVGWGYLSDDILLLTESEHRIEAQAFRRFFALTANTMAATRLQSTNILSRQVKERVTPENHFKGSPVQAARVETIIFPQIGDAGKSELKQLTAVESMQRLLRLCPWASYDKPTSGDHLRVMGLLANTTSAFALIAGADVLIDPSALAELLSSATEELAYKS